MTNTKFNFASEAFHDLYWRIVRDGVDFAGTKALFNVGFTINKPNNNSIINGKVMRDWKPEYAKAEWQWYLSGDCNIEKLGEIYGKVPGIWKRMADKYGNVNSNYGWQWKRRDQLDKVIETLKGDKNTRQAAISIYDGKEQDSYVTDTPCTYAVQFTVVNNKLNMCVVMRSNDLWYGFCNDQYCFSNLQMLVAYETGYELGEYYHFAHNLHLYNNKLPVTNEKNYHL
jgi:thymidylate synthase